MTGLIFLSVIVAWVVASAMISFSKRVDELTNHFFKYRWERMLSKWAVFLFLVLIPIADELIGAVQFDYLCGRYAIVTPREGLRPDRSYVAIYSPAESISQAIVPMHLLRHVAADSIDRAPLFEANRIDAEGGWLIRLIGISETNGPLLFNGSCDSNEERIRFSSKHNLKYIRTE